MGTSTNYWKRLGGENFRVCRETVFLDDVWQLNWPQMMIILETVMVCQPLALNH